MPSSLCKNSFKKEVLEANTLVLVHFWAPWCGLCRMIEPALNRFLQESGETVKLVGINADENLRLASSYRITNLPTVLLFKDGKLIYRFDQLHRRDELSELLREMLPSLQHADPEPLAKEAV
jgi:thioredoxin 1